MGKGKKIRLFASILAFVMAFTAVPDMGYAYASDENANTSEESSLTSMDSVSDNDSEEKEYTVYFKYWRGWYNTELIATQTVKEGECAKPLDNPTFGVELTKKENLINIANNSSEHDLARYTFKGYYSSYSINNGLSDEYDFSQPIMEDTIIYVDFEKELVNMLA